MADDDTERARALLAEQFGTMDEALAAMRWLENLARAELQTAEKVLAQLPWWRVTLQVRMRLAIFMLRRTTDYPSPDRLDD